MSAGKINATYLQELFVASSDTEQTRLAVFSATLLASTAKEVSTAVRDWSKAHKGLPTRKGVQNRGGDIKALKAAVDSGAFAIDLKQGWHVNVGEARRILGELSLTDNGRPLVSKEERQAAASFLAFAKKSAKLAKNDQSKLAGVAVEAAAEVQKDTATRLAKMIVEKHGLVVAEYTAEAILALLDTIARAASSSNAEQQGEQPEEEEEQAPESAEDMSVETLRGPVQTEAQREQQTKAA